MNIVHQDNCEAKKIETFPYKGKLLKVKGVTIKWLSSAGQDENGYPEYGLRFFTVEPGGEIPIHKHYYTQTMYILSGKFECYEYNSENDELMQSVICGQGSAIFVPSMEAHGMKNISSELGTFVCAIANLYEEEDEEGEDD